MANWKEKGEVPDSEDEEELDSQTAIDYDQRNNATDDEFHGFDDVLAGNEDVGGEDGRPRSTPRDIFEEIKMSQASSVDMIQSLDMVNGDDACPSQGEAMRDFPAGVAQDEKQSIEDEVIMSPEKQAPETAVEEISRSWVRALSPESSILSSPPKTPICSSPVAQPFSSPVQRPITLNHSEEIRESSPQQSQRDFAPSGYLPKRQFRERKPVQIHPFLLEQQRYERRMKASHIQPIRIEQSQDRYNRRNRVIHEQDLEDRDFQDPEEIEMDITEESQPMTLDRFPPSQSTLEDSAREILSDLENPAMREEEEEEEEEEEAEADDSDQEFPDLPDLLKQKSDPVKLRHMKPSRKSSAKNRKEPPSPAQNGSKEPTLDIYDFPGSSPTNSPPILFGNTRKPMTGITPLTSSTSSTPVWLDQSSPQFQRTTELHTPITSAIKPSSHTSPLKIMSDSEDPFADPIIIPSSLSASSSASSSEDELLFLKKKMKHVLPASHLRLDQKRKEMREQKLQAKTNKKNNENRAGIALPVARGTYMAPSAQLASRISFLDSDESDGLEENDGSGFLIEDEKIQAPSHFQESDLGFAVEDDRVDSMLPTPSRKRKAKNPLNQVKAKRLMSSSYSTERQELHSHQPKITSHLSTATTTTTARETSKPKTKRRKKTPPKLSIVDIAENSGRFEINAPAFLKVAARSVRSRKELGRQSPTRKFIRLATREDTADAQSVLQDWRNRKIRPTSVPYIPRSENITNVYPLSQVSGNQQTELPPPIARLKTNLRGVQMDVGYTNIRKIRVPRVRQLSMNNFVANNHVEVVELPSKNTVNFNTKTKQGKRPNSYFTAPSARSAQLEASQFPVNTLEPRKKSLDALFRMGHKQPQRGNLQLSRFLADDDVIRPSIESNISIEGHDIVPVSLTVKTAEQLRPRKRLPKRVDAGAAIYRQPSEPLVSDFLTPSLFKVGTDQGKLLGLGKFGTRYPHHFDIFPLQSGIYFHETTFVGSGRLAYMLNSPNIVVFDDDRPPASLGLGDKVFVWAMWNEVVSEQIGVCVDWLTEQLTGTSEVLDKTDLTATTTLILDYVQHSITFPSLDLKTEFLLRMLEILKDFSSRLNICQGSISRADNRQSIEVAIRFSVLTLRLLRMSRADAHVPTPRFEEVLQELAALCIGLLIPHGFEIVRKMYDDLQYLSVRENGIRNNHYVAESWVIIFHVLRSANIPRASFWDVANIQLGIQSISSIQDANKMENLWLSMFSLLPLLAFDEHGCITSRSQQDLGAENWTLVQQLIKRVFVLYATNARQSPSFNDYCRAIVSRCHHLMLKWDWWKCSGIVGALFDFFASQKLANLRNEEVYKSPQFLEDLTKDNTLDVEPEDRCFHIFLKVVAIAIRHQRTTGDTKGIRNLVARILPNHDRQFPKEEAILHRDLASLRNHHDLLCTVYWAAPPGYGPSITLLQKLVSAARSHNEAFLINLRAWERLSRFTLSSIPSSFPVDSYKPFVAWQDSFFNSLLEEYVELTQVRRQLQAQSDGGFRTDVDCNRRSTMSCIQAVARSTMETLRCSNSITLKQAINLGKFDEAVKGLPADCIIGMLAKMVSTGSSKDKTDQELILSAIEVLTCYLHQLHEAEPKSKPETSTDEEEEFDSQGLECDPDWAQEMQFMDDYVGPLDRTITSVFRDSVRQILRDGPFSLEATTNYLFIERLTKCWAQLVSILIKFGLYSPKVFLTVGINAVFEGREQSHYSRMAWPLFLGELLQHAKLLQSDISDFDVGLEWLVAVSKPQHELHWENAFTYQLSKQGHFLLSGEIIDDLHLKLFREKAPSATKNQQLIKDAVSTVQKIFSDKALQTSTFGDATRETIKTKFSNLLNSTMLSMQYHLQKLQSTNTVNHEAYVTFVQEIISQIRSHCSDICPLPEFFFRRSLAYWPPETDPTLYLAGLASYTLQLSSQKDKPRNGLIYYLWNGLRNSLSATDALYSYINRISKGAQQGNMLEFLLTDIVPSALEVAFENESGWLACEVYLVAVSRAFDKFPSSGQPVRKITGPMQTLLQQMFNGICSHYGRFGHSLEAVHPSHQGIITVIFRFWRACRPHLFNLNTFPGDNSMDEVFEYFDNFVEAATACFKNDQDIDIRFKHFNIGKVGNDIAMKEMAREVQNNWRVNVAHGGVDVRMNDGTMVNHNFTNGPLDLREVLEGLLPDPDVQSAGASTSEDPVIPESDKGNRTGIEGVPQIPKDAEPGNPVDIPQIPAEAELDKDSIQPVEGIDPEQRSRGRLSGRSLRANRQKQPEGLPPIVLPDWFWNNVKLVEELPQTSSLSVHFSSSLTDFNNNPIYSESTERMSYGIKSIVECNLLASDKAKYSMHVDVYKEILASIRAGLKLRPSQAVIDSKNILRPILHLQCPKDGGIFYLDSIVETISSKLEADLIRLDPVDIAQILGPYIDENLAWTGAKASLLGYETSRMAGRLEDYEKDSSAVPEDIEGSEEEELTGMGKKAGPAIAFTASNSSEAQKKLSAIFNRLRGALTPAADNSRRSSDVVMPFATFADPSFSASSNGNSSFSNVKSNAEQWNDLKTTALLEALVAGADSKRASESSSTDTTNTRDLIIQVRDYKDLARTLDGYNIIDKLQTVVTKRWQSGRNVIMVGTSSSEQGESELSSKKNLENAWVASAGLDDAVLALRSRTKASTTILGLENNPEIIDGPTFWKAQYLLSESDGAKFSWGAAELKEEDNDVDKILDEINASPKNTDITIKEKLKQIRKTCTPHEKKLLGGVVIPLDIHTKFEDVHAPKETVEALKNFNKPVTDKARGFHLRGATVLEISGAEVNDMYVGEGEKNVRAIFSLAKKLSPCVVFIDEADAIFAARGDTKRSTAHREMINQFLREWDVAAALACIREENEIATKHQGDTPYTYPEKRILTKKHFDKAMEEISASISEDMSTLSAIRKFDEKYGDRKGRRKKERGIGFRCFPERSNVWEHGAASIEIYGHGCIFSCHDTGLYILEIGDDGGEVSHKDLGGFDSGGRKVGSFHESGELDGLVFGEGDGGEVAQLFNEFLTSFEVGGFEGLRGLGETTRAIAAGAAGLFAGVFAVAAKDVPPRIKSMRHAKWYESPQQPGWIGRLIVMD
ncbi:hypothetical protein DID88_005713 [Monilinia fructigena]|uniref:Uncharacterized protein n=1 Tax=Monilinia fructigena TaxID=38457 RepID=A0A395J0M6_9HELO|nr:hypothetical protein DID88_005713 [Monilinia fructigena]